MFFGGERMKEKKANVRHIIKVDESKCTGCGHCIPNCPEGAIKIIDGKARLVSDLFCDGLGACIGHCPEGAISVEEREAEPYDERKVMENIVKQGKNVIIAHLHHLKEHNQTEYLNQALSFLKEKNIETGELGFSESESCERHKVDVHSMRCPGSNEIYFKQSKVYKSDLKNDLGGECNSDSKLSNWPIQLQLLNPNASYLKNANLLIVADCVPFSFANFHKKFLDNKILIIFCPKLDKIIDVYVDKLTEIFKNQDIKTLTLVHMEVPCCFGLQHIVKDALKNSGKNITLNDYTISIKGEEL